MRLSYLVIALATTVGLVACAGSPTKSASNLSPEEAITQRINDRWQYVIDKDYKSAYAYMTEGTRAILSLAEYESRLRLAQIQWKGSKVKSVTCEDAETCKAEVELDIIILVPGGGTGPKETISVVTEDWLKNGSQWYFLPTKIR